MPDKHVVVIGASTSGLFAAYLLAKEGLPVRLYDQGETLGPPPRTLIVTSQISKVLGFVPTEAIVNRVQHIELLSRNVSARVSLQQPDLIVERAKLIHLLAARARQAGAEIELGYKFLGFEGDEDGLIVRLQNRQRDTAEHVRARFLIGADGACSDVARAAQMAGRGTVAILQARVALLPGAAAETVQVWFEREGTRFFYWLIPESKQSAAVGLIADDQDEASEKLQRFLQEHRLEASEYQAAQVATHPGSRPWRRIGGADILLVGDAAGQVKMTTVGGVVTGLRGARAAARAIVQGTAYGKELRALHRELNLHWLIRGVLNHLADADYDRLLDLLNSRAQGILETCSRDEMAQALWGLLLAQPRWLLLGARSFLRSRRVAGDFRS
jgi:flavin-dependent dehydrogenase